MIPEDHFVLACWFTGMFCFGFIFGLLAAWFINREILGDGSRKRDPGE